jgi:hypothetical protein
LVRISVKTVFRNVDVGIIYIDHSIKVSSFINNVV